jgi:hypothetical protein
MQVLVHEAATMQPDYDPGVTRWDRRNYAETHICTPVAHSDQSRFAIWTSPAREEAYQRPPAAYLRP